MNSELTVVVTSCDKYADVLKPFSLLWRKHWPDCPYPVALVTESDPGPGLAFDRVLAFGPGENWCSRLVRALDQIASPYVLLLCDDYYLFNRVDGKRFAKRLEQIRAYGALNLRLIPNPVPQLSFCNETEIREYKKDTAYCIATQAGLWNREFLRSLAEGANSIWEFERYGSFRCGSEPRPILGTVVQEFPFLDAVHKGHWETSGVRLCQENAIKIDFSKRMLPTLPRRFIEWTKGAIYRLSPTWIVRIQNFFALGAKEALANNRSSQFLKEKE